MNWCKQALLLLVVFLLLACAAMAQAAAPRAAANPAAEAEVKALVGTMADLIVRGDWERYAQRLAPDYAGTTYEGRIENKDEALTRLRDPQRKIIVMEMEPDQRLHIYGDTAISNAQFTISVRESGHVRTRTIRIIDVLVKRGTEWYVVAEQETAMGKQQSAGELHKKSFSHAGRKGNKEVSLRFALQPSWPS